MRKCFFGVAFVGVSFILIAAGTRALGSGITFTNVHWNGSAEAEGGNTLDWRFTNNSYTQINAKMSVNVGDCYSKTYSFVIPGRYKWKDGTEVCDCAQPVKWEVSGEISYQFYGYPETEVVVATLSFYPSNLEGDNVELPRP